MKTLYILTLEPIEKRYTKQWFSFWKQEFSKSFKVIYINGLSFSDNIKKGRFLDINKTNIWKAEQIKKVAEIFNEDKIKDNDIFLFMDSWHPGVTAIKYMAQLSNIKCKLYGYWHAGTYDPADFTAQSGLGEWAKYDEIAWLRALDGSFVATQFHKKLILKSYSEYIDSKKIHVVGFPMDWLKAIEKEIDKIPSREDKEDIIVFPHRIDKEKSPEVFDKLALEFPKYKFIKTMEVTKNKKEYYKLLSKAKIVFSASSQETFGIGTAEAMMLDVIPVVPNTLSYKELYDGRFKYTSYHSARQKIKCIMNNYKKYSKSKDLFRVLEENKHKIIKQSLDAIPKMSKIILGDIDG